jgi:hypothetical protein
MSYTSTFHLDVEAPRFGMALMVNLRRQPQTDQDQTAISKWPVQRRLQIAFEGTLDHPSAHSPAPGARGDTFAVRFSRPSSPASHNVLEGPFSDAQTCRQAIVVRGSEVNTTVHSAEGGDGHSMPEGILKVGQGLSIPQVRQSGVKLLCRNDEKKCFPNREPIA